MFTLDDCGVIVEHDDVDRMYYRLIDVGIEYGFDVDRREYEVVKALIRANAVDTAAGEWLYNTGQDVFEYLNDCMVHPGLMFCWMYDEIVLTTDFEYNEMSAVGRWLIDDVRESYGVPVSKFIKYLHGLGYDVDIADDEFTVRD